MLTANVSNTINTLLIIDLVIIAAGIYLFYLSLRMRKTKKVEHFIIAEETLKMCRDEKAFAEYLSIRQLFFSIIMMVCGILMAVHELIHPLGYVYYGVAAVLVIALIVYYKQLSDGRIRYCSTSAVS